jgi:hypothetical protein
MDCGDEKFSRKRERNVKKPPQLGKKHVKNRFRRENISQTREKPFPNVSHGG